MSNIKSKQTAIKCPYCKMKKLSEFVDENDKKVGMFKVCKECGRVFNLKYKYLLEELKVEEYGVDEGGKEHLLITYDENNE